MSIKGQEHSLTLINGHSDKKNNTCFSQKFLGTKFHTKPGGGKEMKIYMNELGHMTKMTATPIYGKTFERLLLWNHLADCHGTWY